MHLAEILLKSGAPRRDARSEDNAASGNVLQALVQTGYTAVVGMVFGAIYIRTGDTLLLIIVHTAKYAAWDRPAPSNQDAEDGAFLRPER